MHILPWYDIKWQTLYSCCWKKVKSFDFLLSHSLAFSLFCQWEHYFAEISSPPWSSNVWTSKPHFHQVLTNTSKNLTDLLLFFSAFLELGTLRRRGEMGLMGVLLLVFLYPLSIMAFTVPIFFPKLHSQFASLNQAPRLKPKIPYETRYYPQLLDHFTFTPRSSKGFYQKYLINAQYWRNGAPIFVYTGNEGDIDWFAANTGFLLDIAPKFHALLVFIEVLL